MNHKNKRIEKLWMSGQRDPLKIARKLGLPNEQRVLEGLRALKLIPDGSDGAEQVRKAGDVVACPSCGQSLVLVRRLGLWACDPGTKRRHSCLRRA